MEDLDLAGKTVLIRADLNVPINDGQVINDNRIRAVLPTIKLAMDTAKKIIIMSHWADLRKEEQYRISLITLFYL